MSYESDDHKQAAAGLLSGVEQNIDDEDRLLEAQQQAEAARAKGDAEQDRPPTRQSRGSRPIGEVEQSALEESQVSANPAAGRIPDE